MFIMMFGICKYKRGAIGEGLHEEARLGGAVLLEGIGFIFVYFIMRMDC